LTAIAASATNLHRGNQPANRPVHDPDAHEREHQAVRLRREDLQPPEPVRPPSLRRAGGEGGGHDGEAEGEHVRDQVPRVREESQRPGDDARDDLGHHQRRDQREGGDQELPVPLQAVVVVRVHHPSG
jgi:hypothetical protein